MDGVDTPRRASYGAVFGFSLLVALGWYVVVPSAVLVAWTGIPAQPAPDEDCWAAFSCPSPVEEISLIMAIVGLPVLAGVVVITVVVAALLARHVRSPIVTGTVAAALCGVVGVVLAVVAVGSGAR